MTTVTLAHSINHYYNMRQATGLVVHSSTNTRSPGEQMLRENINTIVKMRSNELRIESKPVLDSEMNPDGLHPKKTGFICMFQTVAGQPRRCRVRLSVYETSFDHYAVVSQDKAICAACGYINLKSATVQIIDNTRLTFQIIPKDCDANILTLAVSSQKELKDWLSVLDNGTESQDSPPSSPFQQSQSSSGNSRPRRLSDTFDKIKRNSLPSLEEETQ